MTVPAPILQDVKTKLLPNPVEPACGNVTATEDALLKLMYPVRSVASTVYVVPVCALVGTHARFHVGAAAAEPAVGIEVKIEGTLAGVVGAATPATEVVVP